MPRKYKYEIKDLTDTLVREGYIHDNLDIETIGAPPVVHSTNSTEWVRLFEALFHRMENDALKSLEVTKI